MIKHFAADGTVKREWPDGLHASTPFERFGKQFVEVVKSNAIEMIEVADGEQVGEALHAADVSPNPVAADVHPIETALSAIPVQIAPETPESEFRTIDEPITPENENKPLAIVMGTGPDANPMIETKLGELVPASTVHHVPLPSEVVETAAHALSDAAEVLKQEEARNASGSEQA